MDARGRTLIKRGRSYDALIRDHYRGWQFAKTTLTEHYDLEAFNADRPQADVIAEVRTDGSVNYLGPNREMRGGEGVVIISFGPAETTEAGHRAAEASAADEVD